jgi:hypothetical protein
MRPAMTNKTDEELYDILYIHSGDYTAEALESAREEFAGRKLDAPALSELGIAAEGTRKMEAAHLEWRYRIVAFLFSPLCCGIPGMLAHRHYVEQGARRKAREFVRWTLLGFAFYVSFYIITRFIK